MTYLMELQQEWQRLWTMVDQGDSAGQTTALPYNSKVHTVHPVHTLHLHLSQNTSY